MATIRRTLLIEAPVAAVYRLARSFDQLPAFVPGLGGDSEGALEARIRAGGQTLAWRFVLESAVENAALSFVSEGEPPVQRMDATFVTVLGDATWSTWTIDVACATEDDTARFLTAVSRAVSDALTAFREEAERRAKEPPRERDISRS
ncbi:MAG: hypothetical protein IPG47_13435 [Thermoflexaceae bacterium]|jgi:hypothetical protein|nr:hypothetical protein [Thermoflexaceae bacterium]